MHRFFVNPNDIRPGCIHLTQEILSHLHVLRLRANEQFILCDGAETDYICVLDGHAAKILSKKSNTAEPSVAVHLYLALTKGDRMDFAIQKSVELGVGSVMLFPGKRSIARMDNPEKKLIRFTRIAHEAAKQSGRGVVPSVGWISDFSDVLRDAKKADLALFCDEEERVAGLSQVLSQSKAPKSISALVGPEGGFDPTEATAARNAGMISISLGHRILRAETAPLALLARILI